MPMRDAGTGESMIAGNKSGSVRGVLSVVLIGGIASGMCMD